jgi:glutamate racemase
MLKSAQFAALLDRFGVGVEVVTQPCPGLVEQIEAGDLGGRVTRMLVEQYTAPLLERGADTIVLGCTHYPFLRSLITEIVGPQISLIDTGAAVARQLCRVLEGRDLLTSSLLVGSDRFWTSGGLDAAQRVMPLLWGRDVVVEQLPQRVAQLEGVRAVATNSTRE